MNDIQRLLLLLLTAACGWLVYMLLPILSPFLIGAMLAYLGDPIADRLEAVGLNRALSVSLVFSAFTVMLVLILLVTLPMIGQQLELLAAKLPLWIDVLREQLLPWIQRTFDLPEGRLPLDELKAGLGGNWMGAGNIVAELWQRVAGSSLALVLWLTNLVLIPVVSFYLLRDWDILVGKIRESLPRHWEQTVVKLCVECDEILGAFIRGQLLVMLSLGTIYSAGLAMVGIELALLLGLLAGLASIVPYLGFIVGISAAGISAWFQFGELLPLIWVACVFGAGQMLESMVLTPLLVGDRIGLHPVAVIFAIMAGGQLAGFVGVLLALPVAAVIMVWLRYLHRSYKESELYAAATDSSKTGELSAIVIDSEGESP